MQTTHLYTSLTNHVFSRVHACEVILVKVRGGQRSGSDGARKTSDKSQPEHSLSIGRSGGPNYKRWGNSWLIARKHDYQPAQKKLMYECSGATISEVLMHLSLKPYLWLTARWLYFTSQSQGKKHDILKKKEQLESDLCESCPFITEGEGVQQGAETSFSLMFGGKWHFKTLIKRESQELWKIHHPSGSKVRIRIMMLMYLLLDKWVYYGLDYEDSDKTEFALIMNMIAVRQLLSYHQGGGLSTLATPWTLLFGSVWTDSGNKQVSGTGPTKVHADPW